MTTTTMKQFFTLIMVLVVSLISAQEVSYKVLAAKGKNAVEKATKPGDFTPLYTGMKLNSKDKIILGDGGYLGLAGSNGKTLELREKGIYNVADLAGKLATDNSSLALKYVEYIFSDLQSKDGHTSNMSITGSVERSAADIAVDVLCPGNTKILLTETQVNWAPVKDGIEEYHVAVSNFFDEEVYSFDTKETTAKIDLASLNLNKEEAYKLTVVKKGESIEKGEQIVLKFPETEEEKAASAMQSEDASAIQNLVTASYMENNGFYLNSTELYRKAAEQEPSVEDFRKSFENYLDRKGSSK